MDKTTVCPKTFIKRFKKAKGMREQWSSLLNDAYDLFLPNRTSSDGTNAGTNAMAKVFDDTGNQSLNEFVNTLKNRLCPAQQKWAKLEPAGRIKTEILNGDFSQEENDELQLMLDRQSDVLFNYMHDSNVDVALLEAIGDMAISTGAIMIQETNDLDRPMNFVSIPADQLAIEEASDGSIKNVYREWDVVGEELSALWPDRKSDPNLERAIDRNPTTKVKIVEGTVYNHTEGHYDYIVYCEKADCKVIYQAKYEVSPFVVFRWGKTAGETWGRGPALNCMPTMKTLNRLVSDLLKNNAMAVSPPALINAGAVINPAKVKLIPNSRVITKSDWMGNRQPIEFLQTGTNFNLGVGMRDEARQQIREAFYGNVMGGADAPVRSATEISIRNSQMLEQQVAAFTRLNNELLTPLVRRCYHILQRLALVQPLEINGTTVAVKSTSDLSKVQDLKDLDAITQYFQTLIGIGGEQGMGLAASAIDIKKLPRFYAGKMGVPTELILDEEQAAEQAQGLQEQMMQAQQMQQAPMEQPMM